MQAASIVDKETRRERVVDAAFAQVLAAFGRALEQTRELCGDAREVHTNSSLQYWNDGLEAFKVCQPCRAYNLANNYATNNYYGSYNGYDANEKNDEHRERRRAAYGYSRNSYYGGGGYRNYGGGGGNYNNRNNNNNGNNYYNNYYKQNYQRQDPNAGYFQCYDDADYTNVNQCMKFRTHAELEVATWEDLVTATNQGGILEVNITGTVFGSERMSSEQYQYLMQMRRQEVSQDVQERRKTLSHNVYAIYSGLLCLSCAL